MQSKKKLFNAMKDVLPCKYCRESTTEFMKTLPMGNNLALWLYRLHERVNQKLHSQHAIDPNVIDPQKSPPFEEVMQKYTELLKSESPQIPGHDFLLSIAYNYTASIHKSANLAFWNELPKLFPFYEFRKHMRMPDLTNSETYFNDVHAMFAEMGDKETLHHAKLRISKFKSRCKGKTCRAGGKGKKTRRSLLF